MSFNTACQTLQGLFVTLEMCFSSLSPSSPEVILGLPITEVADMWYLGVGLATLYLASLAFPQHCHYYLVHNLMQLICAASCLNTNENYGGDAGSARGPDAE